MYSNELIEAAICEFYKQMNGDNFAAILNAIHVTMKSNGQFIIPVEAPEVFFDMINIDKVKVGDVVTATQDIRMKLQRIQTKDGKEWLAAFTNMSEMLKGASTSTVTQSIEHFLKITLQMEGVEGVIINPWDNAFSFDKETIKVFFEACENNVFISDWNSATIRMKYSYRFEIFVLGIVSKYVSSCPLDILKLLLGEGDYIKKY